MAEVQQGNEQQEQTAFNFEDIKKRLDDDGVAVVPGVLTDEHCDRNVTFFKDWLASFEPRFEPRKFPKNIASIIHAYNIGHCQPSWEARLAAKAVFAGLWDTQKLHTSFDGVSLSRPPEDGQTKFADADRHTLHHDQRQKKQGLHAYQGAVYMEEALEEDWCMEMLIGSHKHHAEFFSTIATSGEYDHRKITQYEYEWLMKVGCQRRRIGCPKGGMILWDSRTVHAGAPPLLGRKNSDRWRYVSFVCMTPAIWASEEDIAAKQDAYHNRKTSRHWPGQEFSCFRIRDKFHQDFQTMPDCATTDEAMQLAGVLPYDFNDGQPNGPEPPTWLP